MGHVSRIWVKGEEAHLPTLKMSGWCSLDAKSPLNGTNPTSEPRPRAKPEQPVPAQSRAPGPSDLADLAASVLVPPHPSFPATPQQSYHPSPPPPRLWLQAPVEGDFDGVAWLGFDHPGTAQGILVEARPARRQDGATGRSQMTTAGSWGERGETGSFLGGTNE